MAHPILRCFLVMSLPMAMSAHAEHAIESGPTRVHLLELYTSEGCSSCPPAERWFSTLQQDPRLWKEIVPIAFHVDYWDQLGWKDRLAAPHFTARQRRYAAAWGNYAVYTPGFVLDGREWREQDFSRIFGTSEKPGLLRATLRNSGDVRITFAPMRKTNLRWEANAAALGFGLTSDVKAGENGGRQLHHDFVVLAHESGAMLEANGNYEVTLHLPTQRLPGSAHALAVWITEAGNSQPVQAAGGAW